MAAAQGTDDRGYAVHVDELASGVHGGDIRGAGVLRDHLDLASAEHASGVIDLRSGKHDPLVHQRSELGQLAGELHE